MKVRDDPTLFCSSSNRESDEANFSTISVLVTLGGESQGLFLDFLVAQ